MINSVKNLIIVFTAAFAVNLSAMDSADVEQGQVGDTDIHLATVSVHKIDDIVDYSANLLDISGFHNQEYLCDSCDGCELQDLDLIRLRMLAYSLNHMTGAPVLTTQAGELLPFIRKSGCYYYFKKFLAPVCGVGGALFGAFLGQLHSYVTMYCQDYNSSAVECSSRNNASFSVAGAGLSFVFGASTGIVLFAKFSKDFEESRNAAQDAVADLKTSYDEMAKALLRNYLSNLTFIRANLISAEAISDNPNTAELDRLYFRSYRNSFSPDFLPAKAGISFADMDTLVANIGTIEAELANETTVATAAMTLKKFKEAVKIIADGRKILLGLVFQAAPAKRSTIIHKLNLLITDEDLMDIIENKLLRI